MKEFSIPRALLARLTWALSLLAAACGSSQGEPDSTGERSSGGGGSSAGTDSNGGSAGATNAGATFGGSGGGGAGTGGSPITGAGGSGGPSEYALASTAHGTCALDDAGAIHCWGFAPAAWSVPAGSFVELHASTDAICAIGADRSVVCFSEAGSDSGVSEVAPTGKVHLLALQRGALCGTDETGKAFCNSSRTLPMPLTPPAGETFSQLSVGSYFACGIRAQGGSISCWGYPGSDSACSLWEDPTTGQLAAPSGDFVAISSGRFSSCAVENSGSVQCWGAGDANDDPSQACAGNLQNFAQSVPPMGAFRSVSVSVNHACGVKTDGSIACWGAGTADECPDATDDCRQSRPPPGTFVQVSLGNFHTCAMTVDRKVQCWGYPGAGGTGDGRLTPPAVFQ